MDEKSLFLSIVRQQYPEKERTDFYWCWEYLVRAIEYGWIDVESLQETRDALLKGKGRGWQEIMFDFEGWRKNLPLYSLLGVSFFGEVSTCTPKEMTDRMGVVLHEMQLHVKRDNKSCSGSIWTMQDPSK